MTNNILNLADLSKGLPGVSPALGMAHLEACLVCLDDQKHYSGITLNLEGDFKAQFDLNWDIEVTHQMRHSWNDAEVTTEWGAYAIAFLLIEHLTDFTVIRKSRKGTGFDYWLGNKDDQFPFKDKARLEVSGIRKAQKDSMIKVRANEKRIRVQLTKHPLPAYVIVVEFSKPIAYTVKNIMDTQAINNLHNQAMDYAERAILERHQGNNKDALILFRKAYELETKAAKHLYDSNNEPSRSVLYRSAATLAVDCGEIREAEKLIATALAGNPPEAIAIELRELMMTVLPQLTPA